MCGIFGQIGAPRPTTDCGELLRHRGPDDGGWKQFQVADTSLWVSLSHRRLSIIDLSPAGRQPMTNEDGAVWIVFNGEIYNFQSLRDELIATGHRFSSKTDTETIVHGYEQWGDDIVRRLRGMFAFAIWDSRRRRMLIARDRIGKKPLFYTATPYGFIFGSEIKSLLATGDVPSTPNPAAIHDYLTYLYFPAPYTAFQHISKLPPATCLEIAVQPGGRLQQRQWSYWDPVEVAGNAGRLSERAYIERARAILEESVRIRMISDVPVGIFLSGGIDSSVITALASRNGTEEVNTFSIGVTGQSTYDERPYAAMVAQRFRTVHHSLEADPTCAEHVPTVVRHFDEPFGNPTAILEYLLTRVIKRHATVALSGDGGDELFAGYERHRGALLARHYRRLPGFLTRNFIPALAAKLRDGTEGNHALRRLREFGQAAGLDEAEMYINWIAYYSEAEKRELYTPEFSAAVGVRDSGDFLRDRFRRGQALEPLSRLGYADLVSFLSCNCLEYADRMAMANSVEIRCPLADHELVEFALHVPDRLKIRGLETKWLLKRAAAGLLPPEILKKTKVGFNPPMPQWMHSELKPLIDGMLSREVVKSRGLFNPDVVERIKREHRSRYRDNTFKLWSLLMLEVWYRLYIDRQDLAAVRDECALPGIDVGSAAVNFR